MSKFDSILAEAAYAVAGHGFAEEFGDVAEPGGWNALADVSATVLLNLDEVELRARFVAKHGNAAAGYLVWIRENSDGHVSLVEYGSDEGVPSGTYMVGRMFDAARLAAESVE